MSPESAPSALSSIDPELAGLRDRPDWPGARRPGRARARELLAQWKQNDFMAEMPIELASLAQAPGMEWLGRAAMVLEAPGLAALAAEAYGPRDGTSTARGRRSALFFFEEDGFVFAAILDKTGKSGQPAWWITPKAILEHRGELDAACSPLRAALSSRDPRIGAFFERLCAGLALGSIAAAAALLERRVPAAASALAWREAANLDAHVPPSSRAAARRARPL